MPIICISPCFCYCFHVLLAAFSSTNNAFSMISGINGNSHDTHLRKLVNKVFDISIFLASACTMQANYCGKRFYAGDNRLVNKHRYPLRCFTINKTFFNDYAICKGGLKRRFKVNHRSLQQGFKVTGYFFYGWILYGLCEYIWLSPNDKRKYKKWYEYGRFHTPEVMGLIANMILNSFPPFVECSVLPPKVVRRLPKSLSRPGLSCGHIFCNS